MNPDIAEKIADEWLRSLYLVGIGAFLFGFFLGYFFRKEAEKK